MRTALALMLLLAPVMVVAQCEAAFDLMEITMDTVLCNKAFDVPSGITIKTDGVTLDCNGAIIRGTAVQDGNGIIIDHADGVTVKNCNILNFDVGVYIKEGNRNTIIHNALLKNKIGIRLLQSFENRFESNADKSLLKPVSALGSKFNSLWLTNKELDWDFCQANLCNSPGPMDPCAHDDFYCSPSCTYENDHDCSPPPEVSPPVTEYPALPNEPMLAPKPAENPAAAAPRATGTVSKSLMDSLPEKTRFWAMASLFISVYLLGFLAFQHHHRHH
jgi:parallel beta-helix repeat protein